MSDGENTTKTYHEKIMITKTSDIDSCLVREKIEDLIKQFKSLTNKEFVKEMKAIILEYISKNSEFEELDIK